MFQPKLEIGQKLYCRPVYPKRRLREYVVVYIGYDGIEYDYHIADGVNTIVIKEEWVDKPDLHIWYTNREECNAMVGKEKTTRHFFDVKSPDWAELIERRKKEEKKNNEWR